MFRRRSEQGAQALRASLALAPRSVERRAESAPSHSPAPVPALSGWCGIRKPLEDVSSLPFLPAEIRERAGLLRRGDVFQLRDGLGLIRATGCGLGTGGHFGESVHLDDWGDTSLSCSAAVPLLSSPLDAFRPAPGPQVDLTFSYSMTSWRQETRWERVRRPQAPL